MSGVWLVGNDALGGQERRVLCVFDVLLWA